jgi:signal transduction histidine kinase
MSPLGVSSASLDAGFREETHARTLFGVRVTCWVGIALFLSFGLMDLIVYPRHAGYFLLLRVATALGFGCVILVSYTRVGTRFPSALGVLAYLWIAGFITEMVLVTGGPSSPYYAGLILVLLGMGVLMPWGWREAAFTAVMIFFGYGLACAAFGPLYTPEAIAAASEVAAEATLVSTGTGTFINNLFFVFGGAAIAVTATVFGTRLRRREYRGRMIIEENNRRLAELDRLKSDFFANISHELRTPLSLSLASLDALEKGLAAEIDPINAEYLRVIGRNSLKLLKLINDLLELSRLDAARVRLQIAKHDLRAVILELADGCQPLAQQRSITITVDIPDDVCTELWFDREQIDKVVLNLLSNSIKFTEDNGKIRISVRDVGDGVDIVCADTGIGIPNDKLSSIFERFNQVDSASTRRFAGAGIGLALAKDLVELHEGTIRAESEVDKGTRVTVHLKGGQEHFAEALANAEAGRPSSVVPASDHGIAEWTASVMARHDYRFVDVSADVDEGFVTARLSADIKDGRVLIVDDNHEMVHVLRMQLEKDYEVLTAHDGDAGYELAVDQQPDLIISDVQMPKRDGFELCRDLRANAVTRAIPIILLSAHGEIGDRVVGREQGADAYLTKPFSPTELEAAMHRLLGAREVATQMVRQDRIAALSTLSAGVAHEILNPLGFITSATFQIRETLEEALDAFAQDAEKHAAKGDARQDTAADLGSLRADIKTFLDATDVGVERIRDVATNLRDFSEPFSVEDATPTDINRSVNDTLSLVRPSLPKGVTVRTHLAEHPTALCPISRINQILLNLLLNAVHAVGDSGTIVITTSTEGEHARLVVRDDGPGIPPDVLARVFAPFFTTKSPGKGMGFGLALCERIAKDHGGEIRARSTVGHGAEFTLELPRPRE